MSGVLVADAWQAAGAQISGSGGGTGPPHRDGGNSDPPRGAGRGLATGRQRVAPAVWLGPAGEVSRRVAAWADVGGIDLLVVDGTAVPLDWLVDAAPLLSLVILDGAGWPDLGAVATCCRQVRCRAAGLPFLLIQPATGWTGSRSVVAAVCDAVLRLPADEEEFWIALALAAENRSWAQEMTRRRDLPAG